jgi:hypothetical protein
MMDEQERRDTNETEMDEPEKRETTEAEEQYSEAGKKHTEAEKLYAQAERQHNEAGEQYTQAEKQYTDTTEASKQSEIKRREEAEQRRAPQPFGEAAHRLFLDMWEYVGVDVHDYVNARVPENLLQDLHGLLTFLSNSRQMSGRLVT